MNLHAKTKSKIALLLFTLSLGLAQSTCAMKRKNPDLETQESTHEVQDCKRQKTIRPLLCLPTELLAHIASYLSWKNINSTAMTCSDLYNRFVEHKKIISLEGDLDQIPKDIEAIEPQPRLNDNEISIYVRYKSKNRIEIYPQPFFTFLADKKRAERILELSIPFLDLDSHIPQEISNLKNLKILNLRGSYIKEKDIRNFLSCPNLRKVNLGNIGLKELPRKMAQSNIEELDLFENFLSQNALTIICDCPKLKKLDISDNKLNRLPPEITQLNLKTLNLSGNYLKQLAIKAACFCTSLENLYLSDNGLKRLSAKITQLTNLKTLDLSENELTNLPEEMEQLTNLTMLNLGRNYLEQAAIKRACSCTSLESLDLSDNVLEKLPAEITQLTNLKTLDLSENEFENLPKEMERLTNLTMLNLGRNYLEQTAIKRAYFCTSLEKLDLSDNKLKRLPSEITQLTNLKTLDLSKNNFRQPRQDNIISMLPNVTITF